MCSEAIASPVAGSPFTRFRQGAARTNRLEGVRRGYLTVVSELRLKNLSRLQKRKSEPLTLGWHSDDAGPFPPADPWLFEPKRIA